MNRLGVHVNAWVPGLREMLLWWGPPVIVSLEPDPALLEIHRAYPETTIILRKHFQEHENEARGMWNDLAVDTKGIAAYIAHSLNEYAKPISEIEGLLVAGFNEPTIWDRSAMERYCQYEIYRMAASDYPCALGSFSVGHPDPNLFRYFAPALEIGRARGGVLALHEYSWPSFPATPDGIYTGRTVTLDRLLPSWFKDYPVVISEAGLDRLLTGQGQVGGWQQVTDAPGYVEQLRRYATFFDHDQHNVKIAVYCAGVLDKTNWGTYDIFDTPVSQALGNQTINERKPQGG